MSHPLDGARLKIVRAEEHLQTLKAEIAEYLHGQHWEVNIERRGDKSVPVPSVTVVPPLRLSTIIGDCITNARASLDYIIWELAARYFSPPVDLVKQNDRRITAFPITNNPKDAGYLDRLGRLKNRKIPAAAIVEIAAVQPYNTGQAPLLWLHDLVNTDKHRMPILTVARIPSFAYVTNPDGEIAFGSQLKLKPIISRVGEQLPSGKFATKIEIEADMDGKITIAVTLKDVSMPREPVDQTLAQIIETAANIIPRFDQFFA